MRCRSKQQASAAKRVEHFHQAVRAVAQAKHGTPGEQVGQPAGNRRKGNKGQSACINRLLCGRRTGTRHDAEFAEYVLAGDAAIAFEQTMHDYGHAKTL